MAIIETINSAINTVVWGKPMLVLLVGAGILLTIRTFGVQFRKFGYAMKNTAGKIFKKGEAKEGEITPFQAMSTALAGTVGTGNIAGVTTALTLGGPGSMFWLWITALIGMATKYSEVLLAVRFRERNKDGDWVGGPMYYIQNGLGKKWKWLGVLFAIFGVFAVFGTGNATQVNTIVASIDTALISFGVMEAGSTSTLNLILGIVITILVGLILLGGIKRIGHVAERLVPIMALLYVVLGLGVIIVHIGNLPAAFSSIIKGAFNPTAVTGGVVGAMFTAVQKGVARGIFSNEAGLGSSALVHAGSDSKDASLQGLWSMTEVALDTLVCCTLTALALLTSGAAQTGLSDTEQIVAAFSGIFGSFAPQIMAVVTALFAFCTMIGWCCCGEQAVHYLLGARGLLPYRLMFCAAAGAGAVIALPTVWALSDIANGLMALPNLLGLLLLCRHAGLEKLISRSRRNPAPQ